MRAEDMGIPQGDDMENVIQFGDSWDNAWSMEVDLEAIAADAGKRKYDKENKVYYVDLPMKNAKKIVDLIIMYAKPDDIEKCNEYFAVNKKLFEYLEKKRGRA